MLIICDLLRSLVYIKGSNHYACSTLRQHKFFQLLQDKLKLNGWSKINEDLKKLKTILINPENIKMHIAANLDALCGIKPNVSSILEQLVPSDIQHSKKNFNTCFDFQLLIPNEKVHVRACVVGMGATESSYFIQVAECINDFNHQDIAAILVFLQYFTQFEGPMLRNIRGLSYAYSCGIYPDPSEGLISLKFYQSVNVPAAYKETKNIFETQLSENSVWNQTLFESAKCSMIHEIVEREKSISDLITQSVLLHFRNLSSSYNRDLIKKISEVRLEDLPQIGKKYVMPLFDPKIAKTAMVAPPSLLIDITKEFKKMGIDMVQYDTLDSSILNEPITLKLFD